MKKLGRLIPSDFSHVEKYPLRREMIAAINPAPVTVGVNWYSAFDNPVKQSNGQWWVKSKSLGTIRGGHCVCMPHIDKEPYSWYQFYDQGNEGACFKAGTLISMADGSIKPIEELRLFENVLTAEGNTGCVSHLFGRNYSGDIYRINLWGHNAFECTAEHPILTKRGYVQAKEIRFDDEVCLTAKMPFEDNELMVFSFLQIKQQSPSRARRHTVRYKGFSDVEVTVKNLPDVLTMTAALGRLFGLYLAEGGTTENKVVFTFGKHEENTLVKQCVDLINECFEIDARIQYRPHSINVVIYGKEWRQLFEYLFPGNVWGKSISTEVMKGNREFLNSLFFGWISGDGHKRRGEIQGTTVSKSLAFSMYRIAGSLGYSPVIKMTVPAENEHAKIRANRWDIIIRESRIISGNVSDLMHFVEKHENGTWRKVRKIVVEPYEGVVYNFEVLGDNSYVANGIAVHNCVGYGSSRMMGILNHSRYDAPWLWDRAKEVDEWPDTNVGDNNGTSVRAAMDVLRTIGHIQWGKDKPDPKNGISANRWATNVDDLFSVLQNDTYKKVGAIPFFNSWGKYYPRKVWVPCEIWQRLLDEEGEATMVTDL
jgi:hypothetical protein